MPVAKAVSATVRARMWSPRYQSWLSGGTAGVRPKGVLKPGSPQKAAGIRVEPAMSLAVASGA